MRRLGRVARLVARALHDGRRPVGARCARRSCGCTRTGSSTAASASSTGTRSCGRRCPTSRSTARRSTASSGRSAIRSPTAPARSSSPRRAPRRCSATPPSRCIPTTSATSAFVGKRVRAAARPSRDIPVIADELRRPRIRHRRRQDHAGARLQRLRGRPAPRACRRSAIFNLDATINDNAPASTAGSTATRRARRSSRISRPRACSCRKSRTGWSCRAAGAPAKSSSRC